MNKTQFEFTDSLDTAVSSFTKDSDDSFLGFESKIREIIRNAIAFVEKAVFVDGDDFKITFEDVCEWQKELFEHKRGRIYDVGKDLQHILDKDNNKFRLISKEKGVRARNKMQQVKSLSNQHINLGLRKFTIKKWRFFDSNGFEKYFGDHTEMKIFSASHSAKYASKDFWSDYKYVYPDYVFLEDLLKRSFPVSLNYDCRKMASLDYSWQTEMYNTVLESDMTDFEPKLKTSLEDWYNTFISNKYFEDFNVRLGGVVVNVLSYVLTGNYLVKL